MITRNIIITQIADYHNSEPKSVRGLATLTGQGNMTGFLRVFNVPDDITPLFLAVKIGDKKYIYNDVKNPTDYNFKIVGAPDSDKITMLLAIVKDGYVQGVACGQNAQAKEGYDELFSEISEREIDEVLEKEPDIEELRALSERYEEEEEIETAKEKEPESAEITENGANFYALIQPQLDELFERFPHFKELEDLVQNTEWVKVSYSDDGSQHYILGKLFDGAVVTHLCYGIPAPSRSTAPPNSLVDYCQWLPIKINEPEGEGYWVMYQNAETGENVRM
ncbi:MAG: hypothetical protein IJ301_03235 [Clostridia bacterium]|nr:hypothetical protein [Clostridia bacterium]